MSTIIFDYQPSAIFIHNNTLAVFGTNGNNSENIHTIIYIYNIINRASPIDTHKFKISGYYGGGRKLNNGYMYLVSHKFMY